MKQSLYIYHSQISGYEWNVHRMFITYIHRSKESRNTKNTYDFLVQVRNFLLPLGLKVLRHKERDTHSFYSGFFICPPYHHHHHLVRHLPKASASKRKSTVFSRGRTQLNSDFFKIPKILRARALPVHDVIHIHWSTFLSDFYFDIYERHILPAGALTPALKFAPN